MADALADGAYDTKDDFSYLYHEGIIPGIKTRKNSSVNTKRRKTVLAQIFNYELWRNSVSVAIWGQMDCRIRVFSV